MSEKPGITSSGAVPDRATSRRDGGTTAQELFLVLGVLVIASLPAVLWGNLLAETAGQYPLASQRSPYFVPTHAADLYLFTPLVVVSGFVLFLAPGATLALAFGRITSAAHWLVYAFGLAVVLVLPASAVGKVLSGGVLSSNTLLYLWVGVAFIGWGVAFSRRSDCLAPSLRTGDTSRTLISAGVACWVGVAALIPKLFWENFNLDGVEAFEFGRSLSTHFFPSGAIGQGIFGFFHNFFLFAFPNHWFITVFGPIEASVRVPFILYVAVAYVSIKLLAELNAPRPLARHEKLLMWLGLALYTIVQVYNTNYEPFFADIAEMAATDTLWVLCFLATCYALWTRRAIAFWGFGLMTYFSSPGGLLLIGALLVPLFFADTPDRVTLLKWVLGLVTACILIGVAYEALYYSLILGGAKSQFSSRGLLSRLYPPNLTDFIRFNALLLPCGIVPALSLLAVRRREVIAWTTAGVVVIYFGVLYLQVWTSLHQFTPAMLLPWVVFWQIYLRRSQRTQRLLAIVSVPAIAAAMYLSIPPTFDINVATRDFGHATKFQIGDYERSYEEAYAAAHALKGLLPIGYRMQYPEQPWGTDPMSWLYYASRDKPSGTVVNYVVKRTSDSAPPGMERVYEKGGVSVYVKDRELWRRHRERDLPRVVISPVYEPILRRSYQFWREWAARKSAGAD